MFWKSTWEKDARHNDQAKWLKDLRDHHTGNQQQEPLTISEEGIRSRVKRIKSWTIPGLNMIHAIWLKKLITSLSGGATNGAGD